VSAEVRIATGAGVKSLRLLDRDGYKFSFEMNMGVASIEELLEDRVILNVGNPQCAIFVNDFPGDWRAVAATFPEH
jgi:diaminopimelate epimerase